MPLILVEGPDSSGKTTLARDLQTRLLEVWPEVELEKSPVKEHGWSDNYNTYLRDRANLLHHMVGVQDRTPEISETVYGIMRGKPRGRGWAYELYSWIDQHIFVIFCQNNSRYLMGRHTDAEGNLLQDEDLQVMRLLYAQVHFNLSQVAMNAHPHSFRVASYNWEVDPIRVRYHLSDWLSWQFPERHYDIQEVLG